MLALLKNILITAAMVVATTVVSVSFAAVLALFLDAAESGPPDPAAAIFGGFLAAMLAAVVGVVFCFVTLFIAAATMPPVLGVARLFKLPRPAVDVVGGGLAGLLCASIGIDAFDTGKLAGAFDGGGGAVAVIVALVAGCLLGYGRHAFLVRPGAALAPFLADAKPLGEAV